MVIGMLRLLMRRITHTLFDLCRVNCRVGLNLMVGMCCTVGLVENPLIFGAV